MFTAEGCAGGAENEITSKQCCFFSAGAWDQNRQRKHLPETKQNHQTRQSLTRRQSLLMLRSSMSPINWSARQSPYCRA